MLYSVTATHSLLGIISKNELLALEFFWFQSHRHAYSILEASHHRPDRVLCVDFINSKKELPCNHHALQSKSHNDRHSSGSILSFGIFSVWVHILISECQHLHEKFIFDFRKIFCSGGKTKLEWIQNRKKKICSTLSPDIIYSFSFFSFLSSYFRHEFCWGTVIVLTLERINYFIIALE